jgi:transcriptional regulator with XRE-family HTH domain
MFVVETWPEYVRRIAGGMRQEQISALTGISQTTVSTWLRGAPGLPRAESVIAFARGFKVAPVQALVAAGYLQTDEANVKARTPLSEYEELELVDELRRRMSKQSKRSR